MAPAPERARADAVAPRELGTRTLTSRRCTLGLAEIELADVVSEQLDVDGVLAFAEHVLTNAARLWMELGLDQKQRLQQVLFPEGLRFDGEKFGTAVTWLAFKQLAEDGEAESSVASPAGFGPGAEWRDASECRWGSE